MSETKFRLAPPVIYMIIGYALGSVSTNADVIVGIVSRIFTP